MNEDGFCRAFGLRDIDIIIILIGNKTDESKSIYQYQVFIRSLFDPDLF